MLNRTRWIGIAGVAGLLLTPLGVAAEDAKLKPTAAAAEAQKEWTDVHMRSNFSKSTGERVTRPPIQGSSGYGALAAGTAETRTQVPETLESATQRDWEQGPLNSTEPARAAQKSRNSSGISRASALRAGARSSRGGGRR
jgi:hypothetical protein